MISISSSGALDGSKHLRFKPYMPKNLEDLATAITQRAWSPIIWEQGIRAKSNYVTSKYVALDFDDGKWTLDTALTYAYEHGLEAIIATTKSHQKEKRTPGGKVSPPCDRFRMVLTFDREIDDQLEFEYNMKKIMELMPVDISCKDAGRFYFPCFKIHAVVEGEPYKSLEYTDDMRKQDEEGLKKYKASLSQHKANGTIPQWCLSVLYNPTPEGERHKTAYRMGATLAECGWTLDAIFSVCQSTSLRDIGIEDMKRALENGFNRALSDAVNTTP